MASKNKVENEKEVSGAIIAQGAANLPAEMPVDWGNDEQILAGERLIPKIHLMQGQSLLVADGKAKMGDIVNLVTGEVLGDFNTPVEIIPIKKMPSTWVVYDRVMDENGQSERKFKEIVDVTPQNVNWEWSVLDTKGVAVRDNDYCINFLVLAAKDTRLPFVISFKRTSVKAGKKLVNHFDSCKIDKVAPATKAVKIQSKKMMKGNKPYFVFDLDSGNRPSTKEELAKAFEFFQLYKNQEIKVDNSDLMDVEKESVVDSEVGETSQY